MDEEEYIRIHRSWTEMLLAANYREVAALVLEGALAPCYDMDNSAIGVFVDLPPAAFPFINDDPAIKKIIDDTLRLALYGRLFYFTGTIVQADQIEIVYRLRLSDVEDDWLEKIKEQIVNATDPNQAVITEKVFAREKKQVLQYNEMKFASQSEIRIAQELERRKVLFFPLPLAVRADTGEFYKDHREVDFLICVDGTWGILEVAYHPNRYEQDAEKNAWFKSSGILCIEQRTAERCYNESSKVVEEFLNILKQHKK